MFSWLIIGGSVRTRDACADARRGAAAAAGTRSSALHYHDTVNSDDVQPFKSVESTRSLTFSAYTFNIQISN